MNAQLMELLRTLGWGRADVEAWLKGRVRADQASHAASSASSSAVAAAGAARSEEGGPDSHAANKVPAENASPQTSSAGEQQPAGISGSTTPSERQATNYVETTSCDEAANMLVSLHGAHTRTTADMRDMLGCCPKSQTEECQVKTTKLFQLMVETT